MEIKNVTEQEFEELKKTSIVEGEKYYEFYDDSLINNESKRHVISEEYYKTLTKANTKHYLGDIKWVLYQYICDLNGKDTTIRCGKFAYNRIMKMEKTIIHTDYPRFELNINGEKVQVIYSSSLDKKQLLISDVNYKEFILQEQVNGKHTEFLVANISYPNDIVLYFA